ncbi:MAG: CbbQ/NirQ/NorQ/GpvN family protein [Chloroflexi bacterium]|nr:CbbQ/NirQ/NorQ/GpvN family protein [Chloroflexota bacterium]MYE42119.1 CbbQ/NirQ/NorQ/GpvN family protein [Chloroflexota bacterium]
MVEAVEQEQQHYSEYAIEEFLVRAEPYYRAVGDEMELFAAAYQQHIPVLLKGPTGCGKTRFVEYMAWKLGRPLTVIREQEKASGAAQEVREGEVRVPLVTIACHEDLTASDLVGRYLLDAEGTRWIDGPMTRAVKAGAILYLDEVVEARKDTTVLIHPLTDHRRILPVEKTGSIIEADDRFLLCISYNPGYQSALKDLKHSTRQRFISIEFYYPPREIEREIIQQEAGCTEEQADALAKLGEKIRNLEDHGLQEGASTRLLIYAGRLMSEGIPARRACQVAIVWTLTDDPELQRSLEEVASSIFE